MVSIVLPNNDFVRDVGHRLAEGQLVAFPTETVYGLGADATSAAAVARIFAAKGRPRFNPLISHVTTIAQARREGCFTAEAEHLADAFWPGPLTLVVMRTSSGTVCDLACAGLASIGLRMPSHPVAIALLEAAGRPIAAPSANRSGRLSPTSAEDVRRELGDAVDLVVDGGPCAVGLESTIIGCLDGHVTLLRPGGVAREAIEALLGRPLQAAGSGSATSGSNGILAPGMLTSHYAPNAALRLDAHEFSPDEAGLDFHGQLGGAALDLSPAGDLAEAAAHLFGYLRQLDHAGPRRIAVAPIPQSGLGSAINDRLRRAAAPRV